MLKKILKIFGYLLLALIILPIVGYFSFLGWEYITGGNYVKYLNKNSETSSLDSSLEFTLMNDDINESSYIVVGEAHGFKETSKFDVEFFKHLHKNFNVSTYMSELDYVQGNMMNEYLVSGNDSLLEVILKNWVVIQGRNNRDYNNKYKAFHEYYKSLPDNDKFKFIGVDKIQDWELLTLYINRLSAIDTSLRDIIYEKETVLKQIKKRLIYLLEFDTLNSELKFELDLLNDNVEYVENKVRREEVLFTNFYDIYNEFDLTKEKVYGYFGFYHAFLYRINGKHPMTSQIRKSDLGLDNKILSMNFTLVDCDMIINSAMLPEFLRSGSKYSKMPVSYDSPWFMYMYGIQDLKRISDDNSKTIIKLNGENTPYSNTSRLKKTIKVLPFVPDMEMTDEGKPYIHYTILLRNSDWAEPL